ERRRLQHVGPLVAGESGIVVVGAAGKSEGIGVPALESLDPGNLPSSEYRVQHATPIHEFLALAERQLIGRIGDETVVAIVAGASFLQSAVLNGGDAGAVIVIILAVDRFGVSIKGTEREAVRHTLLHFDSA